MTARQIGFENSRGQQIEGVIDHPKDIEHEDPHASAPGVILCHSFTGYKEIPHLKRLAEALNAEGYVTLRFDFADCVGESDGSCEDMSLSKQIDDLRDAISFFESRGEIDPGRIGIAGHSLGGMTCIEVAAMDDRPSAVVSISAPVSAECEKLFQGNEIDRWRRAGHLHFPTRKAGEVKIGWSFYEDLREYDSRESVESIAVPIRFIHGSDDEIVPLTNSEQLYDNANEPKDLSVIDEADHLFREPDHEQMMINAASRWMEQCL